MQLMMIGTRNVDVQSGDMNHDTANSLSSFGLSRPSSRRDALPEGTRIADRFTIRSFLGEGGLGFTYLASDDTRQTYAIKECFPHTLCRRDGLSIGLKSASHLNTVTNIQAQFQLEAEALFALDHRNVVAGGERFEANGTSYIVMSYVTGRRLNFLRTSMIPRFRALTHMSVARGLLHALAHIHDRGYLHNDLSPENILYAKSKHPVVIDFGSCSRLEDSVSADQDEDELSIVKPGYSPPEFYTSGAERTRQSDVYQLGATLISMITRKRPPEAMQRMMEIARGRPDPIRTLRMSGRSDYRRFLGSLYKAVDLQPENRFESVSDWVEHLDG